MPPIETRCDNPFCECNRPASSVVGDGGEAQWAEIAAKNEENATYLHDLCAPDESSIEHLRIVAEFGAIWLRDALSELRSTRAALEEARARAVALETSLRWALDEFEDQTPDPTRPSPAKAYAIARDLLDGKKARCTAPEGTDR